MEAINAQTCLGIEASGPGRYRARTNGFFALDIAALPPPFRVELGPDGITATCPAGFVETTAGVLAEGCESRGAGAMQFVRIHAFVRTLEERLDEFAAGIRERAVEDQRALVEQCQRELDAALEEIEADERLTARELETDFAAADAELFQAERALRGLSDAELHRCGAAQKRVRELARGVRKLGRYIALHEKGILRMPRRNALDEKYTAALMRLGRERMFLAGLANARVAGALKPWLETVEVDSARLDERARLEVAAAAANVKAAAASPVLVNVAVNARLMKTYWCMSASESVHWSAWVTVEVIGPAPAFAAA